MQTLILAPRLFPNVGYYKTIAQNGPRWGIAMKGRFDKRQKDVHRYTIADTQGTLDLTVPIAKTPQRTPWSAVGISSHGGWWDVHRVTLESAYGRTPFFEFYIDRLLPLLQSPENEGACKTLGELLIRSNTIIAPILGIEPPTYNDAVYPTVVGTSDKPQSPEAAIIPVAQEIHVPGNTFITDYTSKTYPAITNNREDEQAIVPATEEITIDQTQPIKPYYQVRQQKFGFIPGLSILDLIFNLGPESALYLRDML